MIDLLKHFGDSYKVQLDDTDKHDPGEKIWHYQLLCQGGHIYPHGGDKLGYASDGRGSIARRLAAMDCITIAQDGSDGVNCVFHVRDFDRVATVVKPRRRRKLSEKQRAEQVERLKAYRFTASQGKTSVV